MSNGATALIIVVAIIVIAAIIALTMIARRRRLQRVFGPEYDRAVSEQDSRLRAEAELTERQRRVRKLNIRPLSDASRDRYQSRWQDIQEEFVDAPEMAVTDAYALVTTVMRERGYPAADDEQAMADLSVDHASTVGHFRAAQEISRNVAHGSVDTEELRQALIHYRELLADLLGTPAALSPQPTAAEAPAPTDQALDYEAFAALETSDGAPAVGSDRPWRVTTPASDTDDPSPQQGR